MTAGPKPFPWARVMHAGLFLLRLEPKAFWALTPAEFCAMTGGFSPASGFDRGALQLLMAAFPDET